MAWDVAPIPGMTFDQYRDQVKQDGWNVREALDEVNHPSKHATGPHWHMAVDGRKEQQPMPTTLGSLMQSAPIYAQQPQQQSPSLASYLQAPLTNEQLQPAQMPDPSAGFVEMTPVAGVKPSTWGQGGKGWQIMGIIGDALQTMGGGRPTYAPFIQEQQQLETQGRQRLAERQAEREARLAEAMRPRVETIGNQIGLLDPRTGTFNPTYTAPQAERTGETERLLDMWNKLPDSDPRKAMIARALRGSTYDPTVYQPKEDYQTAKRIEVKRTAPGKAPSASPAAKLPSGFILD
ncbi:hypothetical protein K7W03_22440 [Sphingobium sp. PNB]|uniref:hypothetical protein n=1 Tax=Sphingobium sp. PNB TaxID=863934 RepID=UPI001CA3BCBD|nr:hypothetical protein [Sphingobium sp. PNB]MCB4862354.1 hypothetical protein [Sphingobium sp. PNB]